MERKYQVWIYVDGHEIIVQSGGTKEQAFESARQNEGWVTSSNEDETSPYIREYK